MKTVRFAVALSLSLGVSLLSGCGAGPLAKDVATPVAGQAHAISGSVYGGQQAVSGAHVYLFAVGTTGYGAASASLLTTGPNDTVGTYALSDKFGNFSFTGNYTCVAGTQVYALALGGDSGSGANSMIGEMAVLGNCPSTLTLATQQPSVNINEVSTIVAAYALSGFAVDSTHISSSGTTSAASGVLNAAALALELNNVQNGTGALSTTPTGGGTVPQALLNTLGNILAACVNSAGPTSSACTTLKTNAVNGTTQPTDTATAAINIAHRPGANVFNLYGIVTSTGPFQPTLATQPADFSVAITYPRASYLSGPKALAIDATGNIWASSPGYNALVSFTPLGAPGTAVTNATYIGTPQGVGIDPSGQVWFTDNAKEYITYFTPSTSMFSYIDYSSIAGVAFQPFIALDGAGNYLTPGSTTAAPAAYAVDNLASSSFTLYNTSSITNPYAVAVDTNNFFWFTSNTGTTTSGAVLDKRKYLGAAGLTGSAGCTGPNYAQGTGIVIDSVNGIWISDAYNSKLVGFPNTCNGAAITTSYSTITAPTGLAIDGNNTLFTVNAANKLGATTTAGTAVSPAGGYTLGLTGTLVGPAIDGSGNAWFVNNTNGTLSEVVGIATPVQTPLSVGALNAKLGQKP